MAVSMERWNGKVAVVTGASSGIGAAVAERLVEEGVTVVGLARRKERIEELAEKVKGKSGKLYALQADITKEEEIVKAYEWVKNNAGPIHILVNNAGIGRITSLIDGQTKCWEDIMNTNVLGLCIATREAVKDMKANNINGHIVHVNSVAGHMVPNLPYMSIYPASKHAVTALTETLRQELNSLGSKVKISSISPGYVNTEVIEAAIKGTEGIDISPEQLNTPKVRTQLQAKDVADAIVYILATPPHVQIHELIIRPIGENY